MAKRVNWNPNLRVDVPDMQDGTTNLVVNNDKQIFDQFVLDNFARIAEGFRVQITAPNTLTVFNGIAFDRSGQITFSEQAENNSRSYTLAANATYYLEVEFVTNESDTDARAFWDPTFDNGSDPSGDARLPGREFFQNVSTRLTPDWRIVTPISTTGFQYVTNANSVRIPVAIIERSLGIIQGTFTAAASTLAETVTAGATTAKVFDSRIFPNVGTVTIGAEIGLSITANDRANNIITLGAPLLAHVVGERVTITGGSTFVQERAAPAVPAPTGASQDARPRYFQGNENRGYGLAQNPYSATGRGDFSLQTIKDEVDFLAAQLRELKFGAERDVDIGGLTPPTAFTASPRYFERAGGVQGARLPTVSVGDGVTVWGDFNSAQLGSAQAAIAAAYAALPSAGGIILFKGSVVYDITTTIVVSKNIIFMGEKRTTALRAAAGSLAGVFDITAGNCHFEWLRLIKAAASASPGSLRISGPVITLTARNCSIEGLFTTAANDIRGTFEQTLFTIPLGGNDKALSATLINCTFIGCTFQNIATGAAAARCVEVLGTTTSNVDFYNCKFENFANANTYLVSVGDSCKNVKFDSCLFESSSTTTIAVGAFGVIGAVDGLTISSSRSTCTSGLFDGDFLTNLTISDCISTLASQSKNGIHIQSSTSNEHLTIRGFVVTATGAIGGVGSNGVRVQFGFHLHIDNSTFIDCPIGIRIDTGGVCQITNCIVQASGTTQCRYGIYNSGLLTVATISGCLFRGFQDTTDGLVAGVLLANGSSKVSITNNNFSDFGSNAALTGNCYGIRINETGAGVVYQNIVISNNIFESLDCAIGNICFGIWVGVTIYNFNVSDNNFVNIGLGIFSSPTLVCPVGIGVNVGTTKVSIIGAVISGNTFQFIGNVASATATYCINFDPTSGIGATGTLFDIAITSNTFTTMLDNGSVINFVGGGRRITISNNSMNPNNNTVIGISMNSEAAQSLASINICNNVIGTDDNTLLAGISILGTANVVTRLIIANNNISGFMEAGFGIAVVTSFTSSENLTISGNTLFANKNAVDLIGIVVSTFTYVTVTGNTITLTGTGNQNRQTLTMDTCSQFSVTGNVFSNQNQATVVFPAYTVRFLSSSRGTVSGNMLFLNTPQASWTGIGANNVDGNSRIFISGNIVDKSAGGVGTTAIDVGAATTVLAIARTNADDNFSNAVGDDPTGFGDVGLNLRQIT